MSQPRRRAILRRAAGVALAWLAGSAAGFAAGATMVWLVDWPAWVEIPACVPLAVAALVALYRLTPLGRVEARLMRRG